MNKEELPEEWKDSIIVANYKKCDKTIIIEVNYIQNFIQYPAVKVNSICRKIIGDHECKL
jgi:hypothetical protein